MNDLRQCNDVNVIEGCIVSPNVIKDVGHVVIAVSYFCIKGV